MMIHFLYLCIVFQQFAGGQAYSGKIVKVGVYDGDGRSEIQVYVGTLEILADQRDDRLQSMVTSKVGGVVMGYLSGSYYTGTVTDRDDCKARMWIEKKKLISANIDCKRKHFVVELQRDGQHLINKKRQSNSREAPGQCGQTEEKVCTLYIETDPFFWKYYRAKNYDEESTKAAIIRTMLDHVMAANEIFHKHHFATNFTVQFVLDGITIRRDSDCEKFNEEVIVFDQADLNLSVLGGGNDSLYSYYDDPYSDPDWYPGEESEEVPLNENNCYEDIEGVANISADFCKVFFPDQAALYLNMFSTADHSNYCLAHIWTYRRLEVLGLADTPTAGSAGLSGFCAFYDHDCKDTFIHELGHSFGATHDPELDSSCAPGGRFGKFIMTAGPLGDEELRREFSPCSLEEMDQVAEELFDQSCLLSRGEIEDNIQGAGSGSNFEILNQNCDPGRILHLIGGYITDLKHYTETKKKTELVETLERKFQNSSDNWSTQSTDSLKTSLRSFFRQFRDSGMVWLES